MGRKPTGKRQYLFLHFTLWVSAFLGVAACGLSTVQLREREMQVARESMAREDFETALEKNRELFTFHLNTMGDQALFMMGVLYAHPNNPGADLERSMEHFQRMLTLFPESERAPEARVWVLILKDLMQMKTSIKNLRREVRSLKGLAKEREDANRMLGAEMEKKNYEINQLKENKRSLEEKIVVMEGQLQTLKGVDMGIEKKRRETLLR